MTHAKKTLAALAAALLLASGSLTPAVADDKDKDDLEGGYTIVAGEKAGMKIDADEIKGSMVRIAENGIIVTDKSKKDVYATAYKLGASTGEGCYKITMTSKLAPSEGVVARGMIEKKGDTVRLIYALPGGDEPTEFKTKEKQLMFVMKTRNEKSKSDDK